MDKNWDARLLRASQRLTEDDEQEFLSLLAQVSGRCTRDVAKVLMRTFSNAPDFGTQEIVISVLSSCDQKVLIEAILEELPRLVREAPEWARILIGQEIDRRPSLLQTVASTVDARSRDALRTVLEDHEFRISFPNAISIKV